MPENVSMQYHETGNVSFIAEAAVTGKTFVAISGDRTGGPGLSADADNNYLVSPCAAGGKPFGVAKYDVPVGEGGGVHGQPGMIVPVTADAAIAAGAEVQVGPNGRVITAAAGIKVGLCLSGVAAQGDDAQIKLY